MKKKLHIIFLNIIEIILCLSIVISICLAEKIFDKAGKNTCIKIDYEYPFSGIDNIAVDDKYIYCYSQYFQAVNTYNHNGKYQFTLKVPNDQNGKGYMYLIDDILCIKNKSGNIYQYKSGELKNIIFINDQEVIINDENKNFIMKKELKDEDEILCYIKEKIIMVNSKNKEKLNSNWDTRDVNGNEYSITLIYPRLIKNGKTIMRPNIFKVILSSPIYSFINFFLYEVIVKVIIKKLFKYE